MRTGYELDNDVRVKNRRDIEKIDKGLFVT
jgi:hypothetical protein